MMESSSLDSVIAEVVAKTSLVELVGADIPLHRKGAEFWGLCPFHAEKTPSFKVDEGRNFYHCFGCGAHGNALDYVIHRQNLPFKDALQFLAERAGVALPEFSKASTQDGQRKKDLYALHGLAMDYTHSLLKKSSRAQEAREYLMKRGVTEKVLNDFQLGYDDGSLTPHLLKFYPAMLIQEAGLATESGGVLKGRFVQRILFPILDVQRRVIAFGGRLVGSEDAKAPKYLNSKESPLFHKGSQLYNLYAALTAAKEKSLVLVEGYMDVLTMASRGFPQTVAALGTALTETQMETLWRYTSQPILCFDGDAAGMKASLRAMERALPLLKPEKTFFFCYLPEGKDPDELLRSEGVSAMQKRLDEALPLIDVLWKHLVSPYEMKNKGREQWIPEDWAALKRDIFQTLRCLAHEDVREFYRKLLLARFFQKQWIPRETSKRKRFKEPQPDRFLSRKQVGQKILLGILLKNPILLSDVDELVAGLDFDDSELRDIQVWLLDRYFCGEGFNDEGFDRQRDEFLEQIGLRTLRTHAAFLFDEGLTQDEVLRRWKEIWRCTVESDGVEGDLRQAYKNLRQKFDEQSWCQVKALLTDADRLGRGERE